MAAFNDSGPSRKRIATYGKAVRKRPPDHIAFKALQDLERPPGAPRAASVISASTESVITDSSPSPSSTPSTNLHIFDVPSSDDDASRTPQKRRKLVHVARALTATSVKGTQDSNNTVLQHVANKTAEPGPRSKDLIDDVSISYQHDSRRPPKPPETRQSALERSKIPELHRSDKISSMTITRASQKDSQIRAGPSWRHSQQDSASSSHSEINPSSSTSSGLSKSQSGASTTPQQLHHPTNGKRSSRPGTPKAVDSDARDVNMALSASSILTPKGVKMWNDLLGEDSEDSEAENSERSAEDLHYGVKYQSASRKRKLPRRRLIDTLVEQSKNPKSMLDLYPDPEEDTFKDSDLAPPSQVVEKQESVSTQLANVQKSPERVSSFNKTVGLGQSSQTLGAKITYSRQRSMLAEQDLAKETSFDIPLHEGLPLAKLQNRRGSIPVLAPLHSLHENAEDEEGNLGVAIRTIHELRQAGAESRFKDEVEDLLDRIGKPGPQNTTRRSGLMDLAEKMREKLFYTKFINNGLDQRLFLHLGQEQDVISGYILVSLLIPVLEAGITPMVVTQLRRQGITRLLIRLISVDDSILALSKAHKNNMSKVAQATLMEQHEAFLQLRVWADLRPQVISPRTASLRCLELIVRQSREAGDTGDIISKELVSNLFTILKTSHHNKAAKAEAIDFQLALSTLVSHSLNPMTGVEEFLPIIRNILEDTMQNPSEGPTVILLLRLVLNTTNNSPAASDAFASPELLHLMCLAVIEKFRMLSGFIIEDQRLVLVDHLVLILVVMINIAELSNRARQCFLAIEDSSLEDLVMIFQDNIERAFEVGHISGEMLYSVTNSLQADSVEDSHLNVAGGYLAVLLGCLSLSPEIGERIRMRQRTPSLQSLIACIDEFISHHKKVDALLKDEGEHNPQAGLTDRLQTLVDKLKEINVS
jgi:Wings apart-like protein regulation of heterochromatin